VRINLNNYFLKKIKKKYDIIIIIPTVDKEENKNRVKEIIKRIEAYTPKELNWNIYFAYEGNDWNGAVNIAINATKNYVKYGLIFLDDDAFPEKDWMSFFCKNLDFIKDDILQFSLTYPNGFCIHTKLYKHSRLSLILGSLFLFGSLNKNRFIPLFFFADYLKKYKYTNGKEPVPACYFSAAYIPIRAILSLKKINYNKNVMYGEDVDFCFRAYNHGISCYRIPGKVTHLGAATKSKRTFETWDKRRYSYLWVYRWFMNNKLIDILYSKKIINNKFVTYNLTKYFIKKYTILLLDKLKSFTTKRFEF